jgi:two-component system OmpR family response regulator
MLQKGGYEFAGEASSGAEAIAGAPATEPDVVLVDIILPDMSGLEVVRRLRPRLPAATIVVCSGVPDRNAEEQSRAAGADGWIFKGEVVQLVAALRRVIRAAEEHNSH